ncbi:riboflavin synthase domain-like protein [Annulohypoxylon maeteangense]|uniref:riboflavin synthase domain-like protein n=1 Tax=Annulohypoxylon maeteangense TaxID=1927788 RepID=UPI002007F8AF|nr:riboflavin synthase domain-like protein [Annulohypoxylon maeteangense]KAI0889046.1 riboflavin synthase domain-like protein [Annulohypoxylon maeteangense]
MFMMTSGLDKDLNDNGDKTTKLEDRRMLILYGSETGNSQDLAGDLERLAERLHFKTFVCEVNDVELSNLLQYPLIIFVISTTGQGEIPRNAIKFWKSLLRKRLLPNCLQKVNFTTFGLGDSSYTKYNWAVRKLHKRLEQLGATEFFPRGEADERHQDGIDGTFLAWSLSLRSHLLKEYPLPEGLSPIPPEVQLPPKFTLELVSNMDTSDEPMPDRDTRESKVPGNPDADGALATATLPSGNSHPVYQEKALDRTAALFSHPDTPNPNALEQALRAERMSINSNTYAARLSENTAKVIKGGIDTLDRPNVLRDHPSKYSLEDSSTKEALPPADLLPIPRSWSATLVENHRVTPASHWQDVRHLVFDVPSQPDTSRKGDLGLFSYVPGDAVVIYPKNFPADVQALIDLMGWQDVADLPFEHRAAQLHMLYTQPRNCHPLTNSTLRQLLLHNYDITAIPKRIFFQEIAFYTNDATHSERLREFSNPSLSDEFYDYTSRPRRSILEVLQDFPSVKIPYEHVPSIFPVMRGREYSVASGGSLLKSGDNHQVTRVELLVALVKYKTVLRKTRQGLCSRYLASLSPGTIINMTHREYDTLQTELIRRPLLAISPGTGVAPIRAHVWDRHDYADAGDILLVYGGRNRDADFYFKDEWDTFGIKVLTAFSRDQAEKIYVQDRIRENALTICDIIQKRCVIFICGSSGKMPEAVRSALYDAMVIGKLAPDREVAKKLLHSHNPMWEEVW